MDYRNRGEDSLGSVRPPPLGDAFPLASESSRRTLPHATAAEREPRRRPADSSSVLVTWPEPPEIKLKYTERRRNIIEQLLQTGKDNFTISRNPSLPTTPKPPTECAVLIERISRRLYNLLSQRTKQQWCQPLGMKWKELRKEGGGGGGIPLLWVDLARRCTTLFLPDTPWNRETVLPHRRTPQLHPRSSPWL